MVTFVDPRPRVDMTFRMLCLMSGAGSTVFYWVICADTDFNSPCVHTFSRAPFKRFVAGLTRLSIGATL